MNSSYISRTSLEAEAAMQLPANWQIRGQVDGVTCHRYYERTDGAYVWYDKNSCWSNPENPLARFWIAYGPGPANEPMLVTPRRSRKICRIRTYNRWKTPLAAIMAVNRAFPLLQPQSEQKASHDHEELPADRSLST